MAELQNVKDANDKLRKANDKLKKVCHPLALTPRYSQYRTIILLIIMILYLSTKRMIGTVYVL